MQVKDYIQALHDENKIHVEKIGSGNWYWVWANEEKTQLVKIKDGLEADLLKIQATIEEAENKRNALSAELGANVGPQEEKERKKLFTRKDALETEIAALKTEEEGRLNGTVGGGIEQKEAKTELWKNEAE
ncbi:hypothetical protein KEM55_007214, partial [Ascosphaera atra]